MMITIRSSACAGSREPENTKLHCKASAPGPTSVKYVVIMIRSRPKLPTAASGQQEGMRSLHQVGGVQLCSL